MHLQKLEINGFKSFAKKVSLEFDRGITTIVGPNGSGKSNVAEAVRWVMGEQGLKQLRAKHGQDVIFSGSDKASRQGMAQVSLDFDNSDGQAPVDYRELSMERKLYRDGHSEYFLNSAQARLADIQLLLAQVNLSSKTYSVIGQGMIDSILSASAADRKTFFEEASGVRPLQLKKNEALRKLSHTRENLQTVNIQLGEIAPRLRSLTRQVKRLERRAEIEVKLRDLLYHYFGESLYKLKTRSTELKGKEQNLAAQSAELEEELKRLQEIMASLTKDSSHSDTFTKAQEQYQSLLEEKAKLKEEELKIKEELIQAAQERKQTQVPIELVRAVSKDHAMLAKKLRELVERLRSEESPSKLAQHQGELEKIAESFDKLLDPVGPYVIDQDVSKFEHKLEKIHESIQRVDHDLEVIQRKIKDLAELEKKEKVKIWQTQSGLQDQQRQLNSIVNEHHEVRVELARVETHQADLEAEIAQEVGPEFLDRVSKWQPADKNEEHGETSALRNAIHKLKHELDLIGGIDPEVQQEYSEIKERYDFLEGQLKDLEETMAQLEGVISELDETIKQRFYKSFRRINHEFQKFFKMLFRGGRAELKLIKGVKEAKGEDEVEEEDNGENTSPLAPDARGQTSLARRGGEEVIGVEISATPPGKRLKSISMLSGGERALTSIALICAIIANNPAPFVVLDEVDAALDEENSARFGEIIDELSHKTQFIIITHNRATMEKADLLYGVTMGDDGISKVLSLKLEAAEQYVNR